MVPFACRAQLHGRICHSSREPSPSRAEQARLFAWDNRPRLATATGCGIILSPAMNAIDISSLGTAVLCAVLVLSGFAFALSVLSGRGRTHLISSARNAVFATCSLVALSVGLLG